MTGTAKHPVMHVVDGRYRAGVDDLAVEAHISISSNAGHSVDLLGTPLNVVDLAIGHAVCEGWWLGGGEPPTVEHELVDRMEVLTLTAEAWSSPLPHRHIVPSCGGCGLTLNHPTLGTALPYGQRVELDEALDLVRRMQDEQHLFMSTGGTHAAALVTTGGWLLREDIGRHSAVDKAIGAWFASGSRPEVRCLIVSGRCGWDVMAKAVRAGVRQVIAIGAISAQAAELARHEGVLVVGFALGERPQCLGPWSS